MGLPQPICGHKRSALSISLDVRVLFITYQNTIVINENFRYK